MDQPQVSWTIDPTESPAVIGKTRRRAVEEARTWVGDLPDDREDAIRRVVSELVTNALVHAGKAGPVDVDLWLTPRGNLALVVHDQSPEPPRPRDPYKDGTAGRGLAVVNAETIAWGWRPEHGGKAVHATIALPGGMPTTKQPLARPMVTAS